MEATNKRKRDVDLPRITYDAATRTFDRLFKEDSLDGMKDVVRKKLGVSASTPVHLSQLRDGRTVDLEDDDDFEAFHSSAYHASTARVKIAIGTQVAASQASATESTNSLPIAQLPEKKKKKERKKQKDASETPRTPDATNAAETDASETLPPAKKRRVSFFESSGEARNLLQEFAESDSTPEQEPTVIVDAPTPSDGNSDAELPKEERRKQKKKNKKEHKTKDKQNDSRATPSKESTPSESEPEEEEEKKKKQKKQKQKKQKQKKDAVVAETTGEGDVQAANQPAATTTTKTTTKKLTDVEKAVPTPVSTEGEPAAKKSKKRARAAESDKPEAEKTAPLVSTEPEVEGVERTTKKQKKAKKVDTDSNTTTATKTAPSTSSAPAKNTEPPAPKTPKKVRRKSDAQPAVSSAVEKQPAGETNTSSATPAPAPANATPVAAKPVAPTGKEVTKPKSKKVSEINAAPSKLTEKAVTEAKTPKKMTKKKADSSIPPEEAEKVRELAREAVQEVLAAHKAKQASAPATDTSFAVIDQASSATPAPVSTRAQTTSKPISSTGTRAEPVTEPAPPAISSAKSTKAAPSTSTDKTPAQNLSTATVKKAAPAKIDLSVKCAICGEEPGHIRSKCPIVKKGIKAMQKRIGELEKESAPEDEAGCSELIAELHTLIEGKRRKRRTSLVNTAPPAPESSEPAAAASATKSVDASTSSTQVNVVSSAAVRQLDEEPASAKAVSSKQPALSAKNISSARSTQPISSAQPSTTCPPPTQPPPSSQPPPATQPPPSPQPLPSIQLPPSTQTPPSTQAKMFQKDLQKSRALRASTSNPLYPSINDLSLVGSANLAYGDVTSFADIDIEALMRGPKLKLTSKDVPSEDESSADDDDQEPDAVLEEDEVVIGGPRKSSQRNCPSSSDEGDNDEDNTSEQQQPSPAPGVSAEPPKVKAAAHDSPEQMSGKEGGEEEQAERRSFHDIDATNTSRSSLENAGDAAANEAIAADLELPMSTPVPTSAPVVPRKSFTAKEGESDTAVASQEEESSPKADAADAASSHVHGDVDPIETAEEEEQPRSRAESIASGDELPPPPMESTPRGVVLRTRSQRNKVANLASEQPAASQSQATQQSGKDEDPVTARPTRKTRNMTKISELPIPPNPSARVIRSSQAPVPAVTPRATRQRARAASHESEPEAAAGAIDQPDEPVGRPRRAAAAAPKTPAKTVLRAAKTPAKLPPKSAAKPPSSTPVKPPLKTAAKPLLAKAVAANTRTRASRLVADLESAEECDDEKEGSRYGTPADPEVSFATWDTLLDNGPSESGRSQMDSEAHTMVDELFSSPDAAPRASQQARQSAAEDPLFMHSETQQDFPYSQYPDPGKSREPSPDDSDDEDEVLAAIRPTRPRQSSTAYRGLSQITSQRAIFAPRYSSQLGNNSRSEPVDMFGPSDKDESEESDSDTESESEVPQPSHIPEERKAGARVGRRK